MVLALCGVMMAAKIKTIPALQGEIPVGIRLSPGRIANFRRWATHRKDARH